MKKLYICAIVAFSITALCSVYVGVPGVETHSLAEVSETSQAVSGRLGTLGAALEPVSNLASRARIGIPSGVVGAMSYGDYAGVELRAGTNASYHVAEVGYVTNLVEEARSGAVDVIVDSVNSAYYGRRSLLDHYTLSEGEVVADYTWLYELEVFPGHVGKEIQVPIAYTSYAYPDQPYQYDDGDYYLCITGELSSVTPPFTVGCQMYATNEAGYYSHPRLFFIPPSSGVYRVTVYSPETNSDERKWADVTVQKADYDEPTILPRTKPAMPDYDPPAGSHWEFDWEQWAWVRTTDAVEGLVQAKGLSPKGKNTLANMLDTFFQPRELAIQFESAGSLDLDAYVGMGNPFSKSLDYENMRVRVVSTNSPYNGTVPLGGVLTLGGTLLSYGAPTNGYEKLVVTVQTSGEYKVLCTFPNAADCMDMDDPTDVDVLIRVYRTGDYVPPEDN